MTRILVVDDDAAVRRTLRTVLERARYEVVLASNGGEAIRRSRETLVDLVITDVHMPDKNGIETVLELRSRHPALPIIVMSGGDLNPRVDVLGDVLMLGASFTLAKPFTLSEVYGVIERALADRPPECQSAHAGGEQPA